MEAMIFREAVTSDIPQMQIVRNAVKENRLSDPSLVTDADYVEFIVNSGRGWVCQKGDAVVGFAIVDLAKKNVWALFVAPEFEGLGIGRKLHGLMLDWYFENSGETLWLGTAFQTRAARFYHRLGWKRAGTHGKEARFEMDAQDWIRLKKGI